ncbi:MAG: hypothetical protein AAGE99_01050 [Chlamydiota bacterium]
MESIKSEWWISKMFRCLSSTPKKGYQKLKNRGINVEALTFTSFDPKMLKKDDELIDKINKMIKDKLTEPQPPEKDIKLLANLYLITYAHMPIELKNIDNTLDNAEKTVKTSLKKKVYDLSKKNGFSNHPELCTHLLSIS